MQIPLKYINKDLFDDKPAVVQARGWRRIADNEAIMKQYIIFAYFRKFRKRHEIWMTTPWWIITIIALFVS